MAEEKAPAPASSEAPKKAKVNPFTVFILILILFASVITAAPSLNLPFTVPTWAEIFSTVQLSEVTVTDSSFSGVKVHFIDVGQGDCICIQTQGSTVLIDAGENGKGEQVVKYLKKQGVDSIDLAIVSHPHSDHIGGMDEVIEALPVKEILLQQLPEAITPTTTTYTSMLYAVAEKNVKLTSPKNGQVFNLGKLKLTVYTPQKEYNSLNNMSIITRLEYRNVSYLFMGDAESEREQELLKYAGNKLESNVIKVGHHGSSSSSSSKLIHTVAPDYSVISCGKNNDYGNPSKKTLKALSSTEIFRTDYSGTIIIYSDDGEKLKVSEEKKEKN